MKGLYVLACNDIRMDLHRRGRSYIDISNAELTEVRMIEFELPSIKQDQAGHGCNGGGGSSSGERRLFGG